MRRAQLEQSINKLIAKYRVAGEQKYKDKFEKVLAILLDNN